MFEFEARNIIFALVAGLAAYAFGRRVIPWTLLGFIGNFWILIALMLSPKKPRTPLREWNPFTELKRRPKE